MNQSINQSINQSQSLSSRATSRLDSLAVKTVKHLKSPANDSSDDEVWIRLSEEPGIEMLADGRQWQGIPDTGTSNRLPEKNRDL